SSGPGAAPANSAGAASSTVSQARPPPTRSGKSPRPASRAALVSARRGVQSATMAALASRVACRRGGITGTATTPANRQAQKATGNSIPVGNNSSARSPGPACAAMRAASARGQRSCAAEPGGEVPRQQVDGRVLADQLGLELEAEPFFELDDEIHRGRRVEAHLGERHVGADRHRGIVDRAREAAEAPVADGGFAHRRRHAAPSRNAMPRPQAVVVCRPGDTAAIAILRRRTLQWRPLPVKGLAGSAVAGYAVSVTVDAATIAEKPPGERDGAARRWQLLPRLERSAIVTRRADGAATVARGAPAGCFLYGPYWHLQTGTYRLHVAARATAPHHAAQPALGIEILVLSRFQLAWRDFTAAELAAGSGSVTFTVPPELSADGGNEGRFEFRFFHLGNAALCVSAAELERLPYDTAE